MYFIYFHIDNISPIDVITGHCIVTLIHIYILQDNALDIFVCK